MGKIKKHKKKILVGVLVVAILTCLGFSGYKYYEHYQDTRFENKNWMNRHVRLEENNEGVYEVKTDEDIDIFNLVYQDVIENKIEELKSSDNYSLSNPLIIYNPYGTGSQSYYVYLGKGYDDLSYKITTDGYADYEHTLGNKDEYQLVGFIPNEVNTLTLKSGDEEEKFDITTPDIQENVDITLEEFDGDSEAKLTDGLYTVLGHDKNYEANVYLYDNAGVLRNELVLDDYRADRIIFDDDYMYYPYKSRGIMKVNSLGKIEKMYDLGKYRMHHDMVLDDNKLVILVDEVGADTKEDVIITLDLDSGEVKEVVDMKDLLPELYEKAVLPEDYETLDWIHLNCLSLKGDDLILSARELSTIVYVSDYETNPEVKYLITDESMLEGTSYDNLLYEKIGDFDDLTLLDFVAKQGETLTGEGDSGHKEGAAEAIENNIRKKVIEKVTVNPRYYAKMSEILDKLIEERKQGVLDYAEMLEKYIKLAKDVDCPEDNDKYPESIRKSKALMAIYDNTGEDEKLALRIHKAVKKQALSGFRDNQVVVRRIKKALFEILGDDSEVERIYKIIEKQEEY